MNLSEVDFKINKGDKVTKGTKFTEVYDKSDIRPREINRNKL